MSRKGYWALAKTEQLHKAHISKPQLDKVIYNLLSNLLDRIGYSLHPPGVDIPVFKVSEIANRLGVSRQTIYNWIDKLGQDIEPHITEVDGARVVDMEGVRLIERKIGGSQDDFTGQNFDQLLEAKEEVITELRKQVGRLEKELERRNEQLERHTELLQNFQVIVRQNQERIEELEGEVEERLKWW